MRDVDVIWELLDNSGNRLRKTVSTTEVDEDKITDENLMKNFLLNEIAIAYKINIPENIKILDWYFSETKNKIFNLKEEEITISKKDIEKARVNEITSAQKESNNFLKNENEEKTLGMKFDDGKPMWRLLPFRELREVVDILTFGVKKYAVDNWKKVIPPERYIDAAFRHFTSWVEGEKIDPETGKSHLAHAVCNLLFLMWFDNEKKI